MFLLSGIFNLLSGVLMIWWAFGAINNIFLLIPATLLLIVGCLCIAKAVKQKKE